MVGNHSPHWGCIQREETVIPDERCSASRDPESRKAKVIHKILDPGSRPVSRGLAGMTN
jgi:hypothetical protein